LILSSEASFRQYSTLPMLQKLLFPISHLKIMYLLLIWLASFPGLLQAWECSYLMGMSNIKLH